MRVYNNSFPLSLIRHVIPTSGSGSSTLNAEILVKKLQPVRKKWYIIGMKLGVPSRKLNDIVSEHKSDNSECLAILCDEWVSSSKEASWPVVVDALRSDLINEKELASTLEHQHCWIESQNSKTWVRPSVAGKKVYSGTSEVWGQPL